MKHIFTIGAAIASIDSKTNSLTLTNVLEQLTIVGAVAPTAVQPITLPILHYKLYVPIARIFKQQRPETGKLD